eukprot:TRINITY_DN2250_c0_g1_i3.p1 TRINITY_DN2250_c0_g1~~TRINITY_DN2250_c0_g1_i3.p1  ORF type:complete len:502 (-),score=81.42 TRINITY_DN2250_c0_g1_i3:1688-3193(-)
MNIHVGPSRDPLIVISLGPQCAIAFEGGISVAGGATAAAMKRNMDTTAHKLFPNVPHFQLPFIPLANVAPVPSGGSSMPNGSVIALLNAFDTRVGAKLAKLLAKLHLVARHAVTGLDHNAKALFLRDAFHVQVLQYRPGELADVTRVLQGAYCALYVHRQSAAGAELMHEASLFLCAAKQCGVPVVFFCRENFSSGNTQHESIQQCDDLFDSSTEPTCVRVLHSEIFQNPILEQALLHVTLQRALVLPLRPERTVTWVDLRNVVEVLGLLLLHPRLATKKLYQLRGDLMSAEGMADIFSSVLHEKVQFISEPQQEGLLTPIEEEGTQDSDLQELLGHPPTSFSSWALGVLSTDSQQQRVDLLHSKGGIELLLQQVMYGEKRGHTVIDHADLVTQTRIGAGTSGVVFRGLLQGAPVAIKIFNEQYTQIKDEFVKEAGLVCLLRHPNLVVCIGACTDPPLCLVFELMTNVLTRFCDVLRSPFLTRCSADLAVTSHAECRFCMN